MLQSAKPEWKACLILCPQTELENLEFALLSLSLDWLTTFPISLCNSNVYYLPLHVGSMYVAGIIKNESTPTNSLSCQNTF